MTCHLYTVHFLVWVFFTGAIELLAAWDRIDWEGTMVKLSLINCVNVKEVAPGTRIYLTEFSSQLWSWPV